MTAPTPTRHLAARQALLDAAIARAIPRAARAAVNARVDAIDAGAAPAPELTGLHRTLRWHLDEAIDTPYPHWPRVRALHRVWVAAVMWHRLVGGGIFA